MTHAVAAGGCPVHATGHDKRRSELGLRLEVDLDPGQLRCELSE